MFGTTAFRSVDPLSHLHNLGQPSTAPHSSLNHQSQPQSYETTAAGSNSIKLLAHLAPYTMSSGGSGSRTGEYGAERYSQSHYEHHSHLHPATSRADSSRDYGYAGPASSSTSSAAVTVPITPSSASTSLPSYWTQGGSSEASLSASTVNLHNTLPEGAQRPNDAPPSSVPAPPLPSSSSYNSLPATPLFSPAYTHSSSGAHEYSHYRSPPASTHPISGSYHAPSQGGPSVMSPYPPSGISSTPYSAYPTTISSHTVQPTFEGYSSSTPSHYVGHGMNPSSTSSGAPTFSGGYGYDQRYCYLNPFEVKHRRRTTKSQFRVLESTFQEVPKPNAALRKALSVQLDMPARAVQVWFQNRRAKAKAMSRKDANSGREGTTDAGAEASSSYSTSNDTNAKTETLSEGSSGTSHMTSTLRSYRAEESLEPSHSSDGRYASSVHSSSETHNVLRNRAFSSSESSDPSSSTGHGQNYSHGHPHSTALVAASAGATGSGHSASPSMAGGHPAASFYAHKNPMSHGGRPSLTSLSPDVPIRAGEFLPSAGSSASEIASSAHGDASRPWPSSSYYQHLNHHQQQQPQQPQPAPQQQQQHQRHPHSHHQQAFSSSHTLY